MNINLRDSSPMSHTTNTDPDHPYADLIGFVIDSKADGKSCCFLPFSKRLLNPNNVVHGGAIYSLADTGMGAALMSAVNEAELCATIEIKITYLHAAGPEDLRCETQVIKKGRRVAMLESDIYSGDKLIAKASGSFALFS